MKKSYTQWTVFERKREKPGKKGNIHKKLVYRHRTFE